MECYSWETSDKILRNIKSVNLDIIKKIQKLDYIVAITHIGGIYMKKILIVDDEENIRKLMHIILEETEDDGTEIFEAVDGEEALEIIEREKPQLIYLDIMLPKIDGYDICHRVKTKYGDSIYVVLITAKGQEYDKKKGLEKGADMYLTKPFDPEFILNKTCEILNIPYIE